MENFLLELLKSLSKSLNSRVFLKNFVVLSLVELIVALNFNLLAVRLSEVLLKNLTEVFEGGETV
jgi:hypothetical protein